MASFLDKLPKDEVVSPFELVKAVYSTVDPKTEECVFSNYGLMCYWVTGDIALKDH